MENKNIINMSLNSISETGNPNQLEGMFVVHDFKKSWNNAIITREVCEENMHYLVGQYICCKYIPKEDNYGLDALGSHEAYLDTNRDTGEDMIATDTVPIGHITDAYIAQGVTSDGTIGDVFYCKATLWLNKFYNVLSFLNEMIENGVNVPCSVEYGYTNYIMQDGVRYDQSPIFYEALCILNPIDRGDIKQVLPAYDSSKFQGFSFNEAIRVDIENSTTLKEEGDTEMEETKVTEETVDTVVEPTVENTEETKVEEENKVVEEAVEDVSEKTETEETAEQSTEDSTEETKTEEEISMVETLTSENAKLKEEILLEKESKTTLMQEIASLKEEIEKLIPYQKKVEEMEYNEKLQELTAHYEEKFKALNGMDKFKTEEVEQLLKDCLDTEKSVNAKLDLANILIDLATTPTETKQEHIVKETCGKKVKSLVKGDKLASEYCGINLG